MPKRKAKKVSLAPILQDCNITSASNIDLEFSYPSDESFVNQFGNRDISYYDLNKSSSRSCMHKNDENAEVVESSKVRFKVPFGFQNKKKCRPSLFDSIVNDSDPKCPESDAKPEPFKRKCLQKDISFTITSSNSSLVEAINSPNCRKSTIVNYSGKKVAAHSSKIFESDLESSDITQHISNSNVQTLINEEEENCNKRDPKCGKRMNTRSLNRFSTKSKIAAKEDVGNGTFDSILNESKNDVSIESNSELQISLPSNVKEQKSCHGDISSSNVSMRKLCQLRFARTKKSQDNVNQVFDSDLDVSNISSEKTTQTRQSIFQKHSSNVKSNKNSDHLNLNSFESDLEPSNTSIHYSRNTKESPMTNSASINRSPSKLLFVKAKTNVLKHSDTFESDLEATNTSLQCISRSEDNTLDDTPKSSNRKNYSKNSDILGSNLNTHEDNPSVNDQSYSSMSPTLDASHRKDANMQAKSISGNSTVEINLSAECSSTFENDLEASNTNAETGRGEDEQIIKSANTNVLSNNNENLMAADTSGSDIVLNTKECDTIPSVHIEPSLPIKDSTISEKHESSWLEGDSQTAVQKIQEETKSNASINFLKPSRVSNRKSSLAKSGVSLGKRVSFMIDFSTPQPSFREDEHNSLLVVSQCSKVNSFQQSKNNNSSSSLSLAYESSSEVLNSESAFLEINASSSRNTGSNTNSNIEISNDLNTDENESEECSRLDESSISCETAEESNSTAVNSNIYSEAEDNSENENEGESLMDGSNSMNEKTVNREAADVSASNDRENGIGECSNIDESGAEYEDQSSTKGNSNSCSESQTNCENNTMDVEDDEQSEVDGSQADSEYEGDELNSGESQTNCEDNSMDAEDDEQSEVDGSQADSEYEGGELNSGFENDENKRVERNKMSGIESKHDDDEEFEENNTVSEDDATSGNKENHSGYVDHEFDNEDSIKAASFVQPNATEFGKVPLKGRNDQTQGYHWNEEDINKSKGKRVNKSTQDPVKRSSLANKNVYDEYGSFLQSSNDEDNLIPHSSHQFEEFEFKRPYPINLSKKSARNILKNIPFSELKSKKRYTSEENREQTLHNEIEKSLKNRKCKKPTKSTTKFANNARLKKPKKWVTSLMYEFLINKLKPKCGISSRVEAEKLVLYLAKQADKVLKIDDLSFYEVVKEMKSKLAGLGVIETHIEFRDFVFAHFDGLFIRKVFPLHGNAYNPLEHKNMFEKIPV